MSKATIDLIKGRCYSFSTAAGTTALAEYIEYKDATYWFKDAFCYDRDIYWYHSGEGNSATVINYREITEEEMLNTIKMIKALRRKSQQ